MARVAIRSRNGAANTDTRSDRCSAIRLGASSPNTRVRNEIASVTTAIESADGQVGVHVLDQPGLQAAGQGGRAERAGQQGGQGDADLDGGQEPVRVLGQFRGPLPAFAPFRERPHLAVAQRHQGHLGGREEAADEHNDQDNKNVPADGIHVWIPDLGS